MKSTDQQPPVALVTGAARRIGAAIARRLAAAGYRLVLHCRNSVSEAQELATELGGESRARLLVGDLTDPGFQAEAIPRAAELFGDRLDLLVNNASAYLRLPLADTTPVMMQLLFGLNCFAPVELMRQFAKRRQAAAVVNILDGRIAKCDFGASAYHLAKQTLAMATEDAALEFAGLGIRVNGVAPGLVCPAEGVPLERMDRLLAAVPLGCRTTEEQVAEAVLFLAKNTAVTGEILYVDGGLHLADADIGEKPSPRPRRPQKRKNPKKNPI